MPPIRKVFTRSPSCGEACSTGRTVGHQLALTSASLPPSPLPCLSVDPQLPKGSASAPPLSPLTPGSPSPQPRLCTGLHLPQPSPRQGSKRACSSITPRSGLWLTGAIDDQARPAAPRAPPPARSCRVKAQSAHCASMLMTATPTLRRALPGNGLAEGASARAGSCAQGLKQSTQLAVCPSSPRLLCPPSRTARLRGDQAHWSSWLRPQASVRQQGGREARAVSAVQSALVFRPHPAGPRCHQVDGHSTVTASC